MHRLQRGDIGFRDRWDFLIESCIYSSPRVSASKPCPCSMDRADRVRGLVLGCALGDAVGLATECATESVYPCVIIDHCGRT